MLHDDDFRLPRLLRVLSRPLTKKYEIRHFKTMILHFFVQKLLHHLIASTLFPYCCPFVPILPLNFRAHSPAGRSEVTRLLNSKNSMIHSSPSNASDLEHAAKLFVSKIYSFSTARFRVFYTYI